jgi:hypothetical protein
VLGFTPTLGQSGVATGTKLTKKSNKKIQQVQHKHDEVLHPTIFLK